MSQNEVCQWMSIEYSQTPLSRSNRKQKGFLSLWSLSVWLFISNLNHHPLQHSQWFSRKCSSIFFHEKTSSLLLYKILIQSFGVNKLYLRHTIAVNRSRCLILRPDCLVDLMAILSVLWPVLTQFSIENCTQYFLPDDKLCQSWVWSIFLF